MKWSDLSRLALRRATLARVLSDALLSNIADRELANRLPGRIVVAGGGAGKPGSERLLLPHGKGVADVYLDMDASRRPTILADLTGTWPLRDGSAELLVSTWVLEHVPDPFHFMREAARVTCSGGIAVIAVPFLYRVHASPRDYLRFTADSLRWLASAGGFAAADVHPVGGGPIVATTSLVWGLFAVPGAGLLAYAMARVADRLLAAVSSVGGGRGEFLTSFPIAHILVARR